MERGCVADQPQHLGTAQSFEQFGRCRGVQLAAAGLRHSRAPLLIELSFVVVQNLRKPPPKGLLGRCIEPPLCIVRRPMTTCSPSLRPSTTSVLTPSVIPV